MGSHVRYLSLHLITLNLKLKISVVHTFLERDTWSGLHECVRYFRVLHQQSEMLKHSTWKILGIQWNASKVDTIGTTAACQEYFSASNTTFIYTYVQDFIKASIWDHAHSSKEYWSSQFLRVQKKRFHCNCYSNSHVYYILNLPVICRSAPLLHAVFNVDPKRFISKKSPATLPFSQTVKQATSWQQSYMPIIMWWFTGRL